MKNKPRQKPIERTEGYLPKPGEKPLTEGHQPTGPSATTITPPPPPRQQPKAKTMSELERELLKALETLLHHFCGGGKIVHTDWEVMDIAKTAVSHARKRAAM